MNWTQFRSHCRQLHHWCNQEGNESVGFKSSIPAELGAEQPNSYLADQLANSLRHLTGEHCKSAANTYAALPLSSTLIESTQFKRALIYLGYITFVFFIVLSIYQVKVFPQFLAMFEALGTPLQDNILTSSLLRPVFFGAVVIYLLIVFSIAIRLRSIQKFTRDYSQSSVLNYFIFPSIKTHYKNILNALRYPLCNAETRALHSNWVIKHLSEIDCNKQPISLEIVDIIQTESQALMIACERQMRVMSALLAVVLIFAIAGFLASAYSPIFMTGNVL